MAVILLMWCKILTHSLTHSFPISPLVHTSWDSNFELVPLLFRIILRFYIVPVSSIRVFKQRLSMMCLLLNIPRTVSFPDVNHQTAWLFLNFRQVTLVGHPTIHFPHNQNSNIHYNVIIVILKFQVKHIYLCLSRQNYIYATS